MDFVNHFLVFAHIICVVLVVGGWIAHFKTPTVTPLQFVGAIGGFVTGLLIVGVREMTHEDLNHIKIGVKMAVATIILVAALIARLKIGKGQEVSTGLAHAVGGMGLINIAIATLWQ